MHIFQWKKSVWKSYILYDSNYTTFWKMQNYTESKKINAWGPRGAGRRMNSGCSEQWKCSVWFRDGGPLTCICLAQHCATPSVDSCKLCLCVCMCAQSLSRVRLFATLWTVALQVSLSMGFSRQEYWYVAVSSSRDLSNPGIEPKSLALQADSLPSEPPRKPLELHRLH